MEYYFVADFGSTHSGCAVMVKYSNDDIRYIHSKEIEGGQSYVKEETRFAIRPAFLDRLISNFDAVRDCDFQIYSKTNCFSKNQSKANIVWTESSLCEVLEEPDDYVFFERFKVNIREKEKYVEGSNKKKYPTESIVRIFLRLLKIEAKSWNEFTNGVKIQSSDKVHWAVTIPSIWDSDNKALMRTVCVDVFGSDVVILSEPQAALTYHFWRDEEKNVDKRLSVIVDAGGGTTDLACVREERQANGSYKLVNIKEPCGAPFGGNDLEISFYQELAKKLAKDAGAEKKYSRAMNLLGGRIFNEFFLKYPSELFEIRKELRKLLRKFDDDRVGAKTVFKINIGSEALSQWLKRERHGEICDFLQSKYGNVEISRAMLDKCFSVVMYDAQDGIINKIREYLSEIRASHKVSRVILTGGFSSYYIFRNGVSDLCKKMGISDIKYYEKMKDCSGAILGGAVFQLANPGIMIYTAVKSLYLQVWSSEHIEQNFVDELMRQYQRFKLEEIQWPSAPREVQKQKLKEFLEKNIREQCFAKEVVQGEFGWLLPICVKGCPVVNFEEDRFIVDDPKNNQGMDVYESNIPLSIFYSKKNNDVKLVQELKFSAMSKGEYSVEIDVNGAQNGNPIRAIVRDSNRSVVKTIDIETSGRIRIGL